MRYAKHNSSMEQKIRKIEQLMEELGVHIGGDGLITFDGDDRTFYIGDRELHSGYNPGASCGLPRGCDSEALCILE